jgi:hypothetical protein
LPLGTTLGLEMWEYQYLGAHQMATWMDRQLSRSGGVDSGRWRGCPKPRIHRPPSPPEYQALPQSWQRITSPSGQPLPMVALGMRKHDPRLSPPGPICSGQRWLGVPIWWHSPWHTVWVPGLRLQRAWQLRTVSARSSGPSVSSNVARASERKPEVKCGGRGHEALR